MTASEQPVASAPISLWNDSHGPAIPGRHGRASRRPSAFLVGLVVAGIADAGAGDVRRRRTSARRRARANATAAVRRSASFADIAERLNPAVVNIDATSRGGAPQPPPRSGCSCPTAPTCSTAQPDRDRDGPRRGAGTGFIIDPERATS